MARRQYSDNDKATALAALDANGGNVYKTARQLGIPRPTLQSWADDRGVHPEVSELRQVKKGELADRLKEIAHTLIDALPGKINDANLQQAGTTLGIVVDKMQLLEGKATERVDHTGLTDAERVARIAALADRARTRRTGQPERYTDD